MLNWGETGQGRTIPDLRHTAVCIWLASGVKPGVVKSWAGHASLSTTDIYIHHLGTEADAEGLALLNQQMEAHAEGRPPKQVILELLPYQAFNVVFFALRARKPLHQPRK